jgi:hypothetical protein
VTKIFIRENNWVARIAAYQLKSSSCAIVLGRVIFLYNVSRHDLLSDDAYLRHEVAHVHQWQKHGYLMFAVKYLWYSFRYGYYNNPFEAEARAMEKNAEIMKNVIIC